MMTFNATLAAAARTPQTVSIAITGSGGAGAMTTATMLVDAAGQVGWYGYMTRSSGAQIRGGEAAAMVNALQRHATTETIRSTPASTPPSD